MSEANCRGIREHIVYLAASFRTLANTLIGALELAPTLPICGADTFDFRKPHPRHLLSTIAQAGDDRARTLMADDSRTDIDTAKAVGIPMVAVDFGYTDRHAHECARIESDYDYEKNISCDCEIEAR